MHLRRFRPITLVPCMALSLALLSPRATGLVSSAILVGVLITLHELGHFLVARWMKAPVDVFSIGFGPRLLGFKWKETDVRLSAIPLGGYVRLAGETSEVGTGSPLSNTFFTKPYSHRMAFYMGGIVANLLTGMLLLMWLQMDAARTTTVASSPAKVDSVLSGMPAEKGGLKPGDQIRAIGTLAFPGSSTQDAVSYIGSHGGQPVRFAVERDGRALELWITPEGVSGSGKVGMTFGYPEIKEVRRPMTFADVSRGVLEGAKETVTTTVVTAKNYLMLFTGQISFKHVSGPVGIVKMGSQAAQAGANAFLAFAALLSLNLAVLNAIPIPGLDGSHAVILTFERLRRKELSVELKEKVLMTGFYLMLGLLMVFLVKDIFFKQ